MRSRDLRPLLNNLTSLEEINVTRTTFDIDSWDFMRFSRPRYLTALNVLFLQHCQHVTGTMVQDMLCSMPNLEFFQANYIAASDMARDGRNWVCTGLRELSLDFVVDNVPSTVGGEGPASSAEQEAVESHANRRLHVSEILVLTQLSKQRELEVLEMKSRPSAALPANNAIFNPGNVNHARPPRSDILRLDLQHGLELLQTLSRLRVLSRDDTSTTIEVTWKSNEVKWAMAHWPKLQKLQGFKCTDEAKILLKGYTGLVVQNWRVAEPATRQWW
ncbi:hypothetical protein BGZ83_003451 [Gryganskiella cystojenkinii]|nr:hypothetical protein BGZ83_003451 [Gryganskiella cystojenkinii]